MRVLGKLATRSSTFIPGKSLSWYLYYDLSDLLQQDLLSVIGGEVLGIAPIWPRSAGAETNLVGWILARVWPTMATGEIVYDSLQ